MKKLLLIFLCLTACQSEKSSETIYVEDTAKLSLIKNFFNLKKDIDNTYSLDTTVQKELDLKSRIIDTLLERSLDYKENTVDIFVLKQRYENIVAEKVQLVEQGKTIKKENEFLKLNNISLAKALEKEKAVVSELTGKNKELYKTVLSAADVIISNVQVKGFGHSKGFFSSSKKIYTNKVGKIEGFEISFTFPRNDLAITETKAVNIAVYSTDGRRSAIKDTTVNYEGIELPIQLMMLVENLALGSHDLLIYINNEKQYASSYTVIE